jgi:hypothetical protein
MCGHYDQNLLVPARQQKQNVGVAEAHNDIESLVSREVWQQPHAPRG